LKAENQGICDYEIGFGERNYYELGDSNNWNTARAADFFERGTLEKPARSANQRF
jgi:hypothetical protein